MEGSLVSQSAPTHPICGHEGKLDLGDLSRASQETGQQEEHRTQTQEIQRQTRKQQHKQRQKGEREESSRAGRGGQTGRFTAQGVVSWSHVKPTQRGKPKTTKRQAQHDVEGNAPHRAEAFAAIQTKTQGRRRHTISRPVSTRRKVKQTGRRPDRRRATRQPNGDNRAKPSETLISTARRQGGAREEGSREKAPNSPKTTRTNTKTKHRDKPPNTQPKQKKGGKRANLPADEATNRTRNTTAKGQDTHKPTTATRERDETATKTREGHQEDKAKVHCQSGKQQRTASRVSPSVQVCPIHVCGSARHRYTSCGTISTLPPSSLTRK